ncbi:MAG: M15 family metallopeptidase [Candidatus Kaiserbacteria bacterium]|nr:MAG: M15 family metallopeptidase [Candidatus Kaiserbacteria bacterium]
MPSRKKSHALIALLVPLIALSLALPSFAALIEGNADILNAEDLKKVTGGCESNPYPLLRSRYTPGPKSAVEGADGINKLNGDFGCRLAKLLAAYPSVCINSAYRSNATQAVLWQRALAKYGSAEIARKWVAPPGGSNHNKGLAADLCNMPDDGIPQQAAARVGLTFRLGNEPWHIEPSGAVAGEIASGGAAPGLSLSPSSGISGALREGLLGKGDQSQQMCTLPDGLRVPCNAIQNSGSAPPGGGGGGGAPSGGAAPVGSAPPPASAVNSTAYQQGVCAPAFRCLGSDRYYRTSTCVDQLYQSCPNGCTGTECNPSPTSDLLAEALKNAPKGTSSTSTTKVSAIDQINSIAGPNANQQQPEIAPPIIVVSAEDAARLQASQQQQVSQGGTNAGTLVPTSQETFISDDFRGNAGTGTTEPQSNLLKVLNDLKGTVLGILNYLKPFSFRSPPPYDDEEIYE